MKNEVDGRREIASRNTVWANIIARKLTHWGVTPNQISMMSVFFSMVGCLLLIGTVIYPGFNKYVAYILFIVCMQSRLLCNLFDGMVAIEGGKKSANGDLYNDMPDRFADALFIIPVGYVAGGFGIELGWLAALLAVMTAYFRWIGAYKTHQHFFNDAMVKAAPYGIIDSYLRGRHLHYLFRIRPDGMLHSSNHYQHRSYRNTDTPLVPHIAHYKH